MAGRSLAEGRAIPAHPDEVREGLREAGERRLAALDAMGTADQARADAVLDIAAWTQAGREAGLEMNEMAQLAGMDRVQLSRYHRTHGPKE